MIQPPATSDEGQPSVHSLRAKDDDPAVSPGSPSTQRISTFPRASARLAARRRWRAVGSAATRYSAVFFLTLILMAWTLKLWHLDFRIPLMYSGDALLHLMFSKAIVENGWYLQNPWLGAPAGTVLYDFPAVDILPAMMIKFMGLFTHDPALLNNLLFLVTFPLTSVIAFFVCRRLCLSTGPSMLSSILYAFLPYHFWRNVGHLYLSGYFVAPLAILAASWVATGQFFGPTAGGRSGRIRLTGAVVFIAIVSTSGVYYPFFAAVFLSMASLTALFVQRDVRHFLAGGLLTAILIAGMIACLLPTLIFFHTHHNDNNTRRGPGESEVYGLKIAQLLLPRSDHRWESFAAVKQRYSLQAPLVNENDTAALGSLGSIGFLALLCWLFFRPLGKIRVTLPNIDTRVRAAPQTRFAVGSPNWRQVLDTMSMFNVVAILVGTIGGFGTIFAFLVSPQLRSLNRISVYIAFFAFVSLGVCLDSLVPRRRYLPPFYRIFGWMVVGLLIAAGVYDETRDPDMAHRARTRHEYRADRKFYAQVMVDVPAGGSVFQFPYQDFPEAGPVQRMGDYSHLRGYIHTHGIRWSYGAAKDGPISLWQRSLADLPANECVHDLALSDFNGITVEREGYADGGVAIADELEHLLGPPSAARPQRLFFSLAGYTRALRASMTTAQWEEAAAAVHPVLPSFQDGFYALERAPGRVWRWCDHRGEISVFNPSNATRHVRVQMLANSGDSDSAVLTMESPSKRIRWTIHREAETISATLDLPPGSQTVVFLCNSQPVNAPSDPRHMVWSASNFQIEEIGNAAAPKSPEPTPTPPASQNTSNE